LYYAVKHYFDNGGGICFIVSAGTYQNNSQLIISNKNKGIIDFAAMNSALVSLENIDEPTLIVVPESVKLSASDYQSLVRSELGQCRKLGDRFAILDLFDGSKPIGLLDLSLNREYFGNQNLKFGTVYNPFLKTNYNYFINKAKTNVEVVHNRTIYNLPTLKNSNPALY
jgi:hypothetical protein